jgi:hypothetical protein
VNVVVYTTDFEPITVIDLPRQVLDKIEQNGGIRLALGPDKDESGKSITPTICTVIMCKVRWFNGEEKPILVTKDEESALLLKPDWLPGQRGVYNLLYNHIKNLTKQLINLNGNNDA